MLRKAVFNRTIGRYLPDETGDPDWAVVLSEIYRSNQTYGLPIEWEERNYNFIEIEHHPLVAKSELEVPWFLDAIEKLDNQGLIEIVPMSLEGSLNSVEVPMSAANRVELHLTEEGFAVAHDQELTGKQNRTNLLLVLFTFALVTVNIIAFLPSQRSRLIGSLFILLLIMWGISNLD